jgi:hypothetical protein
MKKARYDGPSGTGVDVQVSYPTGEVRWVHVDQGHQLPTELEDGAKVPASVRDSLLATVDWSEVNIDDSSKAATTEKSDPAPVAERDVKA